MPKILVLLFLCGLQSGCYYMQAASGQWEVMRKRERIDEVIADPATPEELVSRLTLLSEARDFSITELGLPDNASYRSYTDLQRDYVVWNVFAAPEFSLQAKQWCYPVAGCVSYRGYFSRERAIKASERLKKDGYDVALGGVAAYSTLGKFSDPVLNTMLHWSDHQLVALMFHELAHQVVYVKDDSGFNESFATAVEEIGVRRWLAARGTSGAYDTYLAGREYQNQIATVLDIARDDLRAIYASDADVTTMRAMKVARFEQLGEELRAASEENGEVSSSWLSSDLNNAHLITSDLYEGRLAEFRVLYRACAQSLQRFYDAAKHLARMGKPKRDQVLAAGDLRCLVDGPDG